MLGKKWVTSLLLGLALVMAVVIPNAASGTTQRHAKHSPTARAALASCAQAEEDVKSYVNGLYELVEGQEIKSYKVEGWWQGCKGPYENASCKTQWATYPDVYNYDGGGFHDGQVNIDAYGTCITYRSGL
jgi:hypothetical protein